MNSFTTSQPGLSEATAAEQRAHEPSMEEILASIRRIIADDHMIPISRPQAAAPRVEIREPVAPVAVAPAVEAAPLDPVVPVAPPVHLRPAPRPAAPVAAPAHRQEFTPSAPRPAPAIEAARSEPPPVEQTRQEAPRQEALRQEIPRQEAPIQAAPAPAPRPRLEFARVEPGPLLSPEIGSSVASAFNALTTSMILQNQGMVEEATREMLRPMLKQWLDDNLPIIVERLVRQEIERVARGGR